MQRILYSLFITAFPFILFAQPANDACGGAQTIPTDGTCVGATTASATDGWIGGVGCQASNNVNEVWFMFTATGTQTDITVTNGTMTGDVEVIIAESITGTCASLSLNGNGCGPSPIVATTGNLQPGTVYYVTVNSTGADGTFTICNLNSTPPPIPGLDCPSAAPICNDDPFSQGVFTGIGNPEELSLNSCFGADERQAKWYTFTVDEDGDLEFLIDPDTDTDDYDWALWNTTSGCYTSATTLGVPMACNWSGCPGNTGILNSATDPCSVSQFMSCQNGPSCNAGDVAQFSTTPPVLTAGETYTLLIDNFSSSGGGFSFDFNGTDAELGPDATFGASLDAATCQTLTLDRLTNYVGPNMTYSWNFGDGTTSTTAVPGSHTYATSGLFTVSCQVTDALGCIHNFSIQLDVGCVLLASKLISFEGVHANDHNYLSWEMKSNSEVDYFSIQRSTNGITWEDVKSVSSNNSYSAFYSYKDEHYILSSDNYYRLELHSKSGSVSYSDIIVIENNSTVYGGLFIHSIYPSPVEDELVMEVESGDNQSVTLKFFDMLGYLVFQKNIVLQANINKLTLDLSVLSKGVYMLRMEDNNNRVTQLRKIIKK